MPAIEVQPVGRHKRRGVEQHVPAAQARFVDPVERVLHASEVRLRGIGEQLLAERARVEHAIQAGDVQAEVRVAERCIVDRGTGAACEFAHAVDRVVVIRGQEEL
jgi:hypothetical protein